jgi:hypothetical protein
MFWTLITDAISITAESHARPTVAHRDTRRNNKQLARTGNGTAATAANTTRGPVSHDGAARRARPARRRTGAHFFSAAMVTAFPYEPQPHGYVMRAGGPAGPAPGRNRSAASAISSRSSSVSVTVPAPIQPST